MEKVSIIITSYNQRRTLEFLFASLERQTEKDFEVVIADDGSSDGTAEFCKDQKNLKVRFITQADVGYRKSKILNKALKTIKNEYLIFLDADVIVERHFVEDHLTLRRPDHYVCGRRVELGPEFSKDVVIQDVQAGVFDRFNWKLWKSVQAKDSEHFNRSMRVTNKLIRKLFKYDRPMDILGSNFSAWTKDIVQVNGFNEALEAYWGEDGDLYIRLRNSGKISIGVKAMCVQFHVWHKRRDPSPEHMARYNAMVEDHAYKWATLGINNPAPEA